MKAIIFDLDNTLVDFMKMKITSCEEAISAMIDAGLKINKKEGLRILFDLYDKHGIEYEEIFQEFLKKTINKIDYKILANAVIAYRRVKAGFMAPYPHVHSTLLQLRLRGIKLAIVSDAPRMRAWLRLASMRLTDFFDFVVTFEDTGERKPHPKPFEVVLKQLKLKPKEVLMVGDWPERDIIGAKKLGIKTCFARYGYHQKNRYDESVADYVIDDIKEILKLV